MPLKSKKQLINENGGKQQPNDSEIDNKLRECDLIVFEWCFALCRVVFVAIQFH